jgi:hypothetical protein
MINPKPRSGPTASKIFPPRPGETKCYATNDHERKEATLLTHKSWMADPPGTQNCHFLDIINDEVRKCGVHVDPQKRFDANAQWKYLEGLLEDKVNPPTAERIKLAHQKLPKLFECIKIDKVLTYPFQYDCSTGIYLAPEVEDNLRKILLRVMKRREILDLLFLFWVVSQKSLLTHTLLNVKYRWLYGYWTLEHKALSGSALENHVGEFALSQLNGLAQQAIQKEIAHIKLLPDNLCSYQHGKDCSDATIVDTIVKEVALQDNGYYLAIIDDDAEKMFDRLYIEIQAALLLLAGAGKQGYTEWQCANMSDRTNKLVTDIFVATLKYQCGLPQGNGFSVEIANLYALILLMWWNMDPTNPEGSIAPFSAPRHS